MATQKETSNVELSPRKVAERVKQEGKQKLEAGKSTAAEQASTVASALKSASSELEGNQPLLANYTNQLADTVSRFSTRLRDGSLEDLLSDAQAMARRNPGLFILGGFAVGLVLARFIRASTPEDEFLPVGTDDQGSDARLAEEQTFETSGEQSDEGSMDSPSNAYSPPPNPTGSAGI